MIDDPGQLDRRVTFRAPSTAADGESAGYVDVVTRRARVQPLKGGEAVQASRMAGRQPVIITVRRDALTATIDNAWQAVDARDLADVGEAAAIKWDVTSSIHTEDRVWVEVQAVQLKGGDE